MSMKKTSLLTGLVVLALSSASMAFYGPYGGGPYGGGPGQDRSFNRGYRMAQELNLTTEQQKQFTEIMTKQREEAQVWKEKQYKEAQAWREQHQKKAEEKLSKVLDKDQLAKFKEIKQNRMNYRDAGFGRPGPGYRGKGKGMRGGRPNCNKGRRF